MERVDSRALVRLAGDVAEQEDPDRALGVFLEGCRRVLGCAVTCVVEVGGADLRGGMIAGLSVPETERLSQWYLEGGEHRRDPLLLALRPGPGVAQMRREHVPDEDWYRHPHVAEGWRSFGLDDVMGLWVNRGRALIGVMREWGDRPFEPRQARLLEELGRACAWLFRGPAPHPLPPRLGRLLEQLLTGRSEKEIASALRLSVRTVHKYVEQVYRELGVTSRPDLMARWIPAPPWRDGKIVTPPGHGSLP